MAKPQAMIEARGLVKRYPDCKVSDEDIAFVQAILDRDEDDQGKQYGPAVYVACVCDKLKAAGRVLEKSDIDGVERSAQEAGGDVELNLARVKGKGWYYVPKGLRDEVFAAVTADAEWRVHF